MADDFADPLLEGFLKWEIPKSLWFVQSSFVVIRDDWMIWSNPQVTWETFSRWPHGRYPCGSLQVNGTWFYGTYALDNENHQPGDQLGATRAGRLDDSVASEKDLQQSYIENDP